MRTGEKDGVPVDSSLAALKLRNKEKLNSSYQSLTETNEASKLSLELCLKEL